MNRKILNNSYLVILASEKIGAISYFKAQEGKHEQN